MDNQEPLKWSHIRWVNKRLTIVVYKDKTTGELTFVIQTKRLIGDWKDRNILKASVVYGLESMLAIYTILDCIMSDSDFTKASNRFMGEFERAAKPILSGNLKIK